MVLTWIDFTLLLRIIFSPSIMQTFFYRNAHFFNGLYFLNLEQPKPIYNIDTKRFKSNDLNSTYFWHCRLGHVNEKRILKLHQDGLIHSFGLESFETCESCLLGKMTKVPYAGHSERASYLLGLIHIDVWGPISSISRRGYQYFITFTEDFSRYGYIYLMRHKSESFEKFKVFKNERINLERISKHFNLIEVVNI